MEDNIEKYYKVILLGDNYVGTTCLLNRFIYHEYNPDKYSYYIYSNEKRITLENRKEVSFLFWDLYNHHNNYPLQRLFIKDSHGVMLTYDTTKRSSFESANYRLNRIKEDFNEIPVLALVGLKVDSFINEEVTEEEARKFAEDNNMLFYLTSAKEDLVVDECFNGVMNEIIRKDEIVNGKKGLINLNNIERERPCKRGCLK